MTALVLTAKPSIAAVLIEITGAPAGAVTITRTDLNGSGTVRLQEGQQPISGSLTIFDYEAALNGTVSYDVLDSASAVTSGSVSTNVAQPFINAVVLPHKNQQIDYVTDYDSQQDNSSSVHWIIGREDPLVISGPLRLREGTLNLYVTSYAEALAVKNVAATGEVLLFRQPTFQGLDMYLVPTRVAIRPDERMSSGRHWTVDISYNEVKIPSGPVRSSTWNYDAVTALGTYNTVKAQFATYNALVAGP